jgi:hypothetical protein
VAVSEIEYEKILHAVYEMASGKQVEFPKYATEEMYLFGMTVTEAVLVLGGMASIVVTRQIILSIVVFAALRWLYIKYKEKGQNNIALQLAYKQGLIVPKSHLFPEPKVDAFRE